MVTSNFHTSWSKFVPDPSGQACTSNPRHKPDNRYMWMLFCNKLSLSVLKTHYIICTPRNESENDLNLYIDNVPIDTVCHGMSRWTNWLTAELAKSHRIHILTIMLVHWYAFEGTKKITKIFLDILIFLYYSLASPYFIYCNQMWGRGTYQTHLNSAVLVQINQYAL